MDGRTVVHGQPVDDIDVDEEEMRERGRGEEGVTGENDDTGREIFLSRDEFDMLQALHRVIPLPALSSNILRVFVDEDLQVPEMAERGSQPPARPELDDGDQVRSSPLTRRLSKRGSSSSRPGKPHFEIDLSARTPKQDQGRVMTFAARAIGPIAETKLRK
jgi:hypothetical protein